MKVTIPEVKNNITKESELKYLRFYLAVPAPPAVREKCLFVRVYSPDHNYDTPSEKEKCVLFTDVGKVYHSNIGDMFKYYTIYEVDNNKITLTLGQ